MAKDDSISSSTTKKNTSPYDLNPNDNPGNLITHVKLTGPNYDEWAKAVRCALRSKKKSGFLDGKIPRPADDSQDLDDWYTVNSMLVSWIFNTIDPTLRSTISYKDSAYALWQDITERFHVTNGPRIHQIKSEIADCKQGNSSIADYYGRMKKLWEDLGDYDTPPSCHCGRCTCDLAKAFDRRLEEEKVHQFLLGVNSSLFSNIRSNLLGMEPLPTMNKVYASLTREEQVQSTRTPQDSSGEVLSFAVKALTSHRSNQQRNKDSKDSRFCSHCKRSGHETDTCFLLHGYSEWYTERQNIVGRGANHNKGRGRGGLSRANHVVTSSPSTSSVSKDFDTTGAPSFSDEQWQMLRSFLATKPTLKMTGPHLEDADWSG